jgi:hypothetical protein
LIGVDAAITRFLESAKLVEEDFIKKQAYARIHHPQETLKQVSRNSQKGKR